MESQSSPSPGPFPDGQPGSQGENCQQYKYIKILQCHSPGLGCGWTGLHIARIKFGFREALLGINLASGQEEQQEKNKDTCGVYLYHISLPPPL